MGVEFVHVADGVVHDPAETGVVVAVLLEADDPIIQQHDTLHVLIHLPIRRHILPNILHITRIGNKRERNNPH